MKAKPAIFLAVTFAVSLCAGIGSWMLSAIQPDGQPLPELGRLHLEEAHYGGKRSKEWQAVRNEYVKAHPVCEACGEDDRLEVHHIKPFHLHPELELDPDNLIALCRECHHTFGHLKEWMSFNVSVEKDAADFLEKVKHRPKGDQ